MADFNKAIPFVLKWEGGFGHFKEDPGGATNRGITFALFKEYAARLGLLPNIDGLKSLTEDQAKQIYKLRFWDVMKGDQIINQNIANIIFDAFVNSGKWGLKLAQKEVGSTPDGEFGPKTLQALNAAAPKMLFGAIKEARITYYNNLVERKPHMNIFHKGWLNRVNDLQYIDDWSLTL